MERRGSAGHGGAPAASRLAALAFAGAVVATCAIDELSLEGKRCPCVAGYVCDTTTDLCVPGLSQGGNGSGGDGGAGNAGAAGGGASPGGSGAATLWEVVDLATADSSPFAVEVDASGVYWSETGIDHAPGGAIRRVDHDGSGVTTLVGGLPYGWFFDLDDQCVYYTTRHGHELRKIAKDGSSACDEGGGSGGGAPGVALATVGEKAMGVVVDDTHVYYGEAKSASPGEVGRIFRTSKTLGGATDVLLDDPSAYPFTLALDGDRIYWLDRYYTGVLSRSKTPGDPPIEPEVIAVEASLNDSLFGLATSASTVYWSVGENDVGAVRGRSTHTTSTFASHDGDAYFLALDADHVYWGAADGRVRRVSREVGLQQYDPEIVAETAGTPYGVAVYDGAVYWVDTTDLAVRKAVPMVR